LLTRLSNALPQACRASALKRCAAIVSFPVFRRTRTLRAMAAPALLVLAIGPALPGAGFAQTPKPIDPTTSVVQAPLADDAGAARENDFAARQKALNKRTEENDYRYGVAAHNCYSRFFVNHCLGNARDEMRVTRQQIRKEQLALDDEQRAAHAADRDREAAIKRAQYAAEAPQRDATEKSNEASYAQKQRQNELAAAQRNAEAPQRAANQAAYDRKQADYQKKLDEARARGVQDAQDRDLKAQRYEQKQQEAAQHQAEVEARQKEAAAKQQQRAQQEQQRQEQLKQQQQQQQNK
jgi:hypothetical protein